MLIDILKGWTATNLAYFIGPSITGPQTAAQFVNYQLALGVIAVVGHLFHVFAGFRGGKGVATLFGMILAVLYKAALVSVSGVRSEERRVGKECGSPCRSRWSPDYEKKKKKKK